MTTVSTHTLKRTPLHDTHVALGAKMVPFAGFEMPVQYPTGITAEHNAVRNSAGVFDVSHMGEVIVRGPDAIAFVQSITSNDVEKLAINQVQYSTLLREDGTIVDDLLVYRYADHLMLVINASNRDKDIAHMNAHLRADTGARAFNCRLQDISDDIALLAVQGPNASAIVQSLTDVPLDGVKYYWFAEGNVAGVACTISRTGYTGEDGFELYFDGQHATTVWNALMSTGGITPAGLGSRDSLRLEAGLSLYGNELDDNTTPIEAGLSWLVKLGKERDFLGRARLAQQQTQGTDRKLVGFTIDERALPRHGYPVWYGDVNVGNVSSGCMSPTLAVPIGTCYLPSPAAVPGTQFEIEIRGKRVPARVVRLPFYKRTSPR